MCADNAFYDRSLLDWRKAQKTKSIFRGNLRLSVKVGDLVKYSYHTKESTGIILRFDEDNDPVVRDNKTGVIAPAWRKKVEVISESR